MAAPPNAGGTAPPSCGSLPAAASSPRRPRPRSVLPGRRGVPDRERRGSTPPSCGAAGPSTGPGAATAGTGPRNRLPRRGLGNSVRTLRASVGMAPGPSLGRPGGSSRTPGVRIDDPGLIEPVAATRELTSGRQEIGGNVTRPRAADDFPTIRARMEELRREPTGRALRTIFGRSGPAWRNCGATRPRRGREKEPFGDPRAAVSSRPEQRIGPKGGTTFHASATARRAPTVRAASW